MLPFSRAGLIWIVVALLGITALTAGMYRRGRATPARATNSHAAGSLTPLRGSSLEVDRRNTVYVHVAGCVNKPGLYRLPSRARVMDAISAAGGETARADINALNLAEVVKDGSRILVPAFGESPPPVPPENYVTRTEPYAPEPETRTEVALPEPTPEPTWAGSATPVVTTTPRRTTRSSGSRSKELRDPSEGTININTASQTQLERLPRVGPSTAKKIIEYRREHGGFRTVDELLEIRGIGPKTMEQLRPFVTLE